MSPNLMRLDDAFRRRLRAYTWRGLCVVCVGCTWAISSTSNLLYATQREAAFLAGRAEPGHSSRSAHTRARAVAVRPPFVRVINGIATPFSDPYSAAKAELKVNAELPWERSETEVMVDAMSCIKHYWRRSKSMSEGLVVKNDIHSYWPGRLTLAATQLAKVYGINVPPSPWKPVISVFDMVDRCKTGVSGLKVRKWQSLVQQGCSVSRADVTIGVAGAYVDQSAAMIYRADKEILFMLDVLTREYPRRLVLVTADKRLAKQARAYATVRGPEWFKREVERTGSEGKLAMRALMGEDDARTNEAIHKYFKGLPKRVSDAFRSQ